MAANRWLTNFDAVGFKEWPIQAFHYEKEKSSRQETWITRLMLRNVTF